MPDLICRNCSREFHIKPAMVRRGGGKHCSRVCREEARSGKVIPCHWCSKKVYKSRKYIWNTGYLFCSKKCSLAYLASSHLQENHPNWTGGKHSYRTNLKRLAMKASCELCAVLDIEILVVHHIDCNRNNNQISNLAWLCHNCHFLVHHHENEKQRWLDKRLAKNEGKM